MPIGDKHSNSPAHFTAPTASPRRVAEEPLRPAPAPAPVEAVRAPRAVNARIDADLVDAWDQRLTALALPRGAAHAAALRSLLALDDEELRNQVAAEMIRQKQVQVRRRTAG